jgi:hypothetical protein
LKRLLPLALAFGLAQGAAAQDIRSATYDTPTDVYGHGALAQGEWAAILIGLDDLSARRHSIAPWVFEDTAPRLADLDRDGAPEVVTVVSRAGVGAAIWVWGMTDDGPRVVARTAPIGQHHRWLAIAAVADLDSDGWTEIAYVDRPHLARILRVVTVRSEAGVWAMTEVASAPGHTNHRFGERLIQGGMVLCDVPELITATADWTRWQGTTFTGGQLVTRDLGPYTGADSVHAVLTCG